MIALAQRVLIVEDEPLISTMIEDMIIELGCVVAGSAYREAEAFELLEGCTPTLALLDINLGLTTSLGIAALCKDRGIPVVFTTGYTAKDVPPQCGTAPILSKPFSTSELETAIDAA